MTDAPAGAPAPRFRVGIDASRAFRLPQTGTEVYSEQMVRAIARRASDHEFSLYVNLGRPPDWQLPGNMHWRCLPRRRRWTQVGLSREMRHNPPHLLFVPSHVLPVMHPRLSVVTVHDVGFLLHRDAYRLSNWLYLNASTAWMSRSAAVLLADSEATRRDLVRYYRADPARIEVVHLAASSEYRPRPAAEVDAVRKRYELPERYLLASGTIQRRKNLPFLVEAYARVAGSVEQDLVIAGKPGPDSERLRATIDRLGAGGRVRVVGSVSQADMPAVLSGARALLFPSLYEGFGMPAVEAMACGVPVVASRTSSLTEIVGGFGVLVDPDDLDGWALNIREVCREDRGVAILREQGLRRAGDFSWDRSAARVLQVFDRLLHRDYGYLPAVAPPRADPTAQRM
ncbi:MAG: glycosyltransferase family 4 protein [Candidatus Dormibacteria bacterium]